MMKQPRSRTCVVAALLLAACSSGKDGEKEKTAVSRGGVASIKVCKSVVRALDAEAKCPKRPAASELESLRTRLTSTEPLDDKARENEARWCALLLGERADDLNRRGCPLGLSDEERAWIAEARSRLTAPPEIATASEQDMLDAVADFRDRVCACRDVECSRKLANEARLPTFKDAAAKEAAAKMLDEASVCHRKLEAPERATLR